jgi:hypothetical protein
MYSFSHSLHPRIQHSRHFSFGRLPLRAVRRTSFRDDPSPAAAILMHALTFLVVIRLPGMLSFLMRKVCRSGPRCRRRVYTKGAPTTQAMSSGAIEWPGSPPWGKCSTWGPRDRSRGRLGCCQIVMKDSMTTATQGAALGIPPAMVTQTRRGAV